jgi:hypothetical protein
MNGTTWEDELPVSTLPDDPTWRENFCFDGYDRVHDVGFWIHCGRWSLDPRIWREQVLIYIPDDTYLVHRAWGVRESKNGVSSALLDLICEKPGEFWKLRYRGPARRATTSELQAGPLTEGAQVLVDLKVDFTSSVPMWDMTGGIRDQAWGKFHIEQTGRFLGEIAYEDKSVPIDGLGWHDHSRGPRDFKDMGRHMWIHGNLSRNRSFALTYVENFQSGSFVPSLGKVVIWDGGRIYDAQCLNPPFLTSTAMPEKTYEMTLRYEKGDVEIQAELRRCLPHSTSRYMECFDGVAPGLGHVVTYEQGTVFFVDGEQFDGHSERSYRL